MEARAYGDLIGQSAALRQIISQIDLVAPTDASVLVLGETGTGKEMVAHEIHRRSQRKDGPLAGQLRLIPKDLFESEFFGHVKGAFTGAIKTAPDVSKPPRGHAFLDEIGEVPWTCRGNYCGCCRKTLRARGDDRTQQADVRIIAASNRDLKKAAATGRFREDLYYRLHVFRSSPLLRERRDDIPLLARHFVELSVKELRCLKPRLTRAAVVQLQSYDWPGNVRELRNVIERAVILARGGVLQFDLPTAATASPAPPAPLPGPSPADGVTFLTEVEMRQRERDNLRAVLEYAGWKIKGPDGAAELLGIKPTTLLSRLKKNGLKRPRA